MTIIKKLAGRVCWHLAKRQIYLRPRDRALASLEGKHSGETAFILGMGPSLSVSDLDKLKGRLTFGCNKIYLVFEETDFRPTYYTICDVLVAENNREQIFEADLSQSKVLLSPMVRPQLADYPGAMFYPFRDHSMQSMDQDDPPLFPSYFTQGLVSGGYTVLTDQIQLAWLMGCKTIVLLGVDFSFELGAKTGQNSKSGEVLESRGEVNHFHKDYRKPGETWTVPKMDEQRRAFDYCRRAIEGRGGRLINASRSTKLDVLPRASLEELLD